MSTAVLELKRKRKGLVESMEALVKKDALTADEEKSFGDLKAQAAALATQIERHEFVASERAIIDRIEDVRAKPQPDTGASRTKKPRVENPGFESLGEVIYCARFQRDDSRIKALMEVQTGASGGIMIPDEFRPDLQQVSPQEAIFRPRATVVPAGDMPDAELVLPTLDQTSTGNMFGGVTVNWTAEGGTKQDTSASLKETRWNPKEVSASLVVTDKLLRNWRSAGVLLDRLLRGALLAAEDVAFLSGNGVGRPKGVLACDALIKVNRTTASHIKYADLVNMEAQIHEDNPAVWIVGRNTIPELRQMVDPANRYLWVEGYNLPGAYTNPPTLLGRPVVVNFRSPSLGTMGDVLLADLKDYIIKDGVDVTVAASEHVLFQNNKTMIKAFRTVDGGPWLSAPIVQEDTKTYSPFIALN